MHFNAKRSLAIACRPSVCPSVRPSVTLVDCDHTGWNSSEKNFTIVSLECSLSQTQTSGDYSKGNTRKFWFKVTHPLPVDLSVGDIRSQIAAECLQIAQRSQWGVYRVGQIKWHHFTFLLVTHECIHKILWFLAHINYIMQEMRRC